MKKAAAKSAKKQPKKDKSWVIAKREDGTLQITYTIPFSQIEKNREKVLKSLGANMVVPGFRKGKAPLSKVAEKAGDNTVIEQTLREILPQLVGETIQEEKLRLAIYPRFELIKAADGEDWQVMALTCEIPDVSLGNYKDAIVGEARSQNLWTPDKAKKSKEEPTREQKEQLVIEAFLKTIEIKIPQILLEEEVNARVSRLLERLEKLGISLEKYLESLNKTAPELRKEYEEQARDVIKLDLALLSLARSEKMDVTETEVDEMLKAARTDPAMAARAETEEERSLIKTLLLKRKALDKLISLIPIV